MECCRNEEELQNLINESIGLNPCSNGMPPKYRGTGKRHPHVGVLILVLMECRQNKEVPVLVMQDKLVS